MIRSIFFIWLGIWSWNSLAHAAAPAAAATDHARVEVLAEHTVVEPGGATWLAVRLSLADGWHTYWKNPGDSGEPTRLDWTLPEGTEVGEIVWPVPERIPFGPFVNFGYHGEPIHLVRLEIAGDWPVGRSIRVDVRARWLVCEEICIPEEADLGIDLDVGAAARLAGERSAAVFAQARRNLPPTQPVRGAFGVADGVLSLELSRTDLPAVARDFFFFPGEWGAVEPGAPQDWSVTGDTVVARLTAGPAMPTAILEGIAVLSDPDTGERQAVRIEALPSAATGGNARAPGSPVISTLALWQAVLLAIAGGMLLNLMPCVLPVLSIKALGLVSHSRSPRTLRASGIAYTAGVLCSFALLAVILIGLRSAGAAAGWGFQLQSPGFVAAMSYLLFSMALVLSLGLDLGSGLAGIGDRLTRGSGMAGSFFTGALAAVVATPCTAPFMASAIGFALSQPAAVAATVLLAIGFGLALPYLLLTFVPAWTRFLPRPGPWMLRLKQALAFPLYATVIWLLWVAGQQIGVDGVARILLGLLLLSLALWIYSAWRGDHGRVRRAATAAALLLVGVAISLAVPAARTVQPVTETGDHLPSVPFAENEIERLRASGRAVFVNMTAAWCITCLVNERVALGTDAVREALASRQIVYMKGDWTNRDARISRYLWSFGRAGVPLYVLYPAGEGAPRVLPQILTENMLLEAIDALGQPRETT